MSIKLYDLPRNTTFTILKDKSKTKYFLNHIDGMYSLCRRCCDNVVVHVVAWEEVEKVNDNLG